MDASRELRLMDALLRTRLPPPGALVQALLRIYLEIEHRWDRLRGGLSTQPAAECRVIAQHSEELMRMHYDLPLPLFEWMLGPSMKYSMALWSSGALTLEDAQAAMLADACRKAGVRDGDEVLDIGCGFGSLAAHLLREFPRARVTGLTLSRTQADYIRSAMARPAHALAAKRFTLIEGDFNDAHISGRFDRVLSIGVFEHISNLDAALARVRGLLRPDGAAFLHFIVYQPVVATAVPARQNHFIQQHVFPGGRIYAHNEIARHQRDLGLAQSWFLPGTHYRRTIECWLGNFLRHRGAIAREAGMDEYRLRIWELYLRACAANFAVARGAAFGNGQYLLAPQ